MGTTRSFVFLKNRGDSPEVLRDKLRQCGRKPASAEEAARMQEERERMKLQFVRLLGKPPQTDGNVIQFPSGTMEQAARMVEGLFNIPKYHVIAYRPEVPWLPYFGTDLCDGRITRAKELKKLSLLFQTPVLSFAIMDSDALYLSYYDAEKGESHDYMKPDEDWYLEEFPDDTYLAKFPAFLTELCGWDLAVRLRQVWDSEELDADDRMIELTKLLDTQPLYDETLQWTEGFEKLSAD